MPRASLRFALVAWLALPACGREDDSGSRPCDPVASDTQVEYIARSAEGELLVVVSLGPDVDDYYGSFRLFFGEDDAVLERDLREVDRRRDGGTTHLIFDLDGEVADAFFPVMLDAMGARPGPATLEVGGETVALERVSDMAVLSDLQFMCL